MAENTGDIHGSVNPDQKNSPIEISLSIDASRPKEVVKPRSRHTPPIPVAGGATLLQEEDQQVPPGRIFETITLPSPLMHPGMTPEDIELLPQRIEALAKYRQRMIDSEIAGVYDPKDAFDRIESLIDSGAINPVDAQPYIRELRARAITQEMRRGVPVHIKIAQEADEEIRQMRKQGLSEEEIGNRILDRLKKIIGMINPDVQIDDSLLNLIARYKEPSAMFLDKIISKPFDTEGKDYRLSWYAEINLEAFLTQVKQVDLQEDIGKLEEKKRYVQYGRLHETALRFHQMNKTIIAQSGNINAFIEMTRAVNAEENLQTLTTIDGVEVMRQLLEMAYGRTYAETDIIDGDNFRLKILEWAAEQFRYLVGRGIIKSNFQAVDEQGEPLTDAQGNPILRNLEEWEIRRAIAFGRYIHASFYRHSELLTWRHVEEPYQGWLKSPPTETVVKALGGYKWLDKRFKVGETRGGPELAHLIQTKLERNARAERWKINKLGKLDIKTELLPVGIFNAGGFDKGWRTLWSYLSASNMKVEVTDAFLQQLPEKLREKTREFINKKREEGKPLLLGELLADQEFVAQELSTQRVMVRGYKLPERYSPWDENNQMKLMQGLLFPLLGLRPKQGALKKIEERIEKREVFDPFGTEYFDYDPASDQINLALGVMIQGPVVTSEQIKTRLWQKVADFLPLRIAYFLSDDEVDKSGNVIRQGVRGLPNYDQFKGTYGTLLKEDFEKKLILAQRLRFEVQSATPNQRISLTDNFLRDAGMTAQEILFTRQIQALGLRNAGEFAKIRFPHIPFLDDVPFQKANYKILGPEVFPRRMGSDLSGYSEGNNALTAILDNIGQPYEKIFENMHKIVSSISTAEGTPLAQNMTLPIFESYLQMGEQEWWSKVPFIKTALNALNIPVSELQKIFSANANVYDESDLSLLIREAAKTGMFRFKKLQHEDMSQMQTLLRRLGAEPRNVLFREVRNAILLYLMLAAFGFIGKTVPKELTAA